MHCTGFNKSLDVAYSNASFLLIKLSRVTKHIVKVSRIIYKAMLTIVVSRDKYTFARFEKNSKDRRLYKTIMILSFALNRISINQWVLK